MEKHLERVVTTTLQHMDFYIGKYTRLKGEPIPPKPIPFTQEDEVNFKFLIKNANSLATQILLNTSSQAKVVVSSENVKKADAEIAKSSLELLEKSLKLIQIMKVKLKQLNQISAEKLKTIARLDSLTNNNLGCFFRDRGKHSTALEYLNKTLQIEIDNELSVREQATTNLNICAVLSMLQRHEEALQNSERAIILLEKYVESGPEDDQECAIVLSTAYNNYGVELEHLNRGIQSVHMFQKAFQYSTVKLGANDQHTKQLRNKYEQAKKQY